jgi:exodeoxyribonuclease VII large subunit
VGRLPFDPKGFPKSQARSPAKGDSVLTVSQAAGRIGNAIQERLGDPMRIVGQVSGFRERTHWYFDLKDADAVLGCVMWQSQARRLAFVPEDGQEVVITCTVDFYAKQGRLSLLVTNMQPVGAGALEIAFRALCEELRGLGWFDVERKRPLPTFPNRVGVITSRTGAALQDVLDTMRRRSPGVEIVLLDVRVQGTGAGAEVAAAIRWVSRHAESLGIDAILVTRGGGSIEDLWAFNERDVADAIVRSGVPVVAAIGHETDTTIAELVADARAATPTQAAMLLTPDVRALGEQVDAIASRLHASVERALTIESRRLAGLEQRPTLTDPGRAILRARDRLRSLVNHLISASGAPIARARSRVESRSARIERHRPVVAHARSEARLDIAQARLADVARAMLRHDSSRVEMFERELRAVGPISVLERGYSCTTTEDGRLVRAPDEAPPGSRLNTRLAKDSIWSIVEGDAGPVRRTRRPSRASSKRPEPPQMDLFEPDH